MWFCRFALERDAVIDVEWVRTVLAIEIYNTCTEQVSGSLSWRSIEGIASELFWHYKFYVWNIFTSSAEFANIGGMQKGKPGYDSNAWIFEAM